MTNSPSTESYDFADYLSVLRRRWRTIAGWTLAGVLLAAAYLVAGPKTYTATASVYVTNNAANSQALFGSKTTAVVNMDNEAQVVQSTSVARQAKKFLKSSLSSTALLKNVAVAVPANTQVLNISCSASSPAGSADCAEAFARAYLTVRKAAATYKVDSEIKADQFREKSLESELQTLESTLTTLKAGSADYAAAHSKLANISSRLTPLRSAIATLGASNNFTAGSIITHAINPSTPSSPRKLLYGPSGLMAGLLLGLGLAFLAERRDDRLHAPDDVERFLGVPVLGSLGRRLAEFSHALCARRSEYGRSFAELARITAAELGEGPHAILVTGSPDAGLTGTNLAVALARTRSEVILVLPDPEAAKAPLLARVAAGRVPGLGDVLAGTATLTEAMRPFPGVRRLSVIVAGDNPDLVEDLPSDKGTRLLSELQAQAPFVVVAMSAADEAAMLGMAELAGTVVLVTEIGRNRRGEVAAWLRGLSQMRARMLGTITLPAASRRDGKRSRETAQAPRAESADSQAGLLAREAGPRERPPREADKRTAAQAAGPSPVPGFRKASSPPPVWEPVVASSSRRPYQDELGVRASRSQPAGNPSATRSQPPAGPSTARPQPASPSTARPQPASPSTARPQPASPSTARPQPASPSQPAPPARPATQTWPMPRVLMPDAGKETPSDTATRDAAGRSADEN